MLPTRYWISARAIQKQKKRYLPLVKKVIALPDTQEEKEVITQFALTEDGTPIIIKTEVIPLTK